MKAWLLLLAFLVTLTSAHAQLRVRVSIKQILDPTGNPPSTGILTDQTDAENAITEANRYLDLAGFGYRLEMTDYTLVDNVTLRDGTMFWNLPPSPENVTTVENYARANSYGWRTDAANIYITQGAGTFIGYCSFPSDHLSTIILSSQDRARSRGQLLLHEVGHFYGLGHTFDCCGACCDRSTDPTCHHGFGVSGPSATGITDDLLPDINCNYPDDIATNRYTRVVAQLTPDEFAFFSITYSNLMSYHPQTFRLSNRQKDIWGIIANTARQNTATGFTRFVSNFGFVWGAGSATTPSLASVTQGVNAANPGDVIMIYAGHYNEPQTITKPVTLRASRGAVRIGSP